MNCEIFHCTWWEQALRPAYERPGCCSPQTCWIFDPFFLVVSSHTRADHYSPDRADPPQTSPPSPLRHCPMNSSRLGSLELSLSLQLGLCLAPSLGCSLTPSPGSKLSDHRAHLICFLPLTCLCPLLPHVQCFESHCLINCVSLFHPQAGE